MDSACKYFIVIFWRIHKGNCLIIFFFFLICVGWYQGNSSFVEISGQCSYSFYFVKLPEAYWHQFLFKGLVE